MCPCERGGIVCSSNISKPGAWWGLEIGKNQMIVIINGRTWDVLKNNHTMVHLMVGFGFGIEPLAETIIEMANNYDWKSGMGINNKRRMGYVWIWYSWETIVSNSI